MTGGRPRTTTAYKKATGKLGLVGINYDEPVPTGELPAAPDWMDEQHKQAWHSVMLQCPEGVLSNMDIGVFEAYILALVGHENAATRVINEGMFTHNRFGEEVVAPWTHEMNRQAMLIIRAANEIGMTPAARSKVTVRKRDKKSEKENPASEFFQ